MYSLHQALGSEDSHPNQYQGYFLVPQGQPFSSQGLPHIDFIYIYDQGLILVPIGYAPHHFHFVI